MASLADVYVSVIPSTEKLSDGIKKALLGLDGDMRRAGQRWGREIERGLKDVDVEVDADTTKAKKEIKAVEKGRYTAKVKVDVDQASLAKARAQLSGAGGGGAGKALAGVAKGEGLTAAVGLAPNVVPLIGSAVQAVGQLSGALGLIPAAAGAAGLAMGTLKIATLGFGDAIKAAGDPEKFNEAVAKLAPSAQEAARAILGLMPQVTQLKMTVQDAFFKGFGYGDLDGSNGHFGESPCRTSRTVPRRQRGHPDAPDLRHAKPSRRVHHPLALTISAIMSSSAATSVGSGNHSRWSGGANTTGPNQPTRVSSG